MSYYEMGPSRELLLQFKILILKLTMKDGSFTRYSGLDDMLEDLHYYMQFIKLGWDVVLGIQHRRYVLDLERDEGLIS